MVHHFELRRFKAVERIAGSAPAEAGHWNNGHGARRLQQQHDRVRRALKQAVEPVIRFQAPPLTSLALQRDPITRQ